MFSIQRRRELLAYKEERKRRPRRNDPRLTKLVIGAVAMFFLSIAAKLVVG